MSFFTCIIYLIHTTTTSSTTFSTCSMANQTVGCVNFFTFSKVSLVCKQCYRFFIYGISLSSQKFCFFSFFKLSKGTLYPSARNSPVLSA